MILNIGGGGVDTSKVTATASDVLTGKVFVDKDGNEVTGSIPTQAAKTVTPKESSQTAVNSGVYTTGAITVGAIPSNYYALNFTVVGGTSAPSSPAANTIWVNTSTSITSWIFSATQPSGASGKVWFSIGTSSNTTFNALKKNGIQVYPLFAKQYVGSAWVAKEVKIYQNGAWVSWSKTPAEYQDVEYIQATGTQYLASVFKPNTVDTFRHEFKFNAQSTDLGYLMGVNNQNGRYNFAIENNKFGLDIGTKTTNILVSATSKVDHVANVTIAPKSISLKLDGENLGTADCAVLDTGISLYMFCRRNVNGPSYDSYAKAKLYYWRIYQNDVLIREFLPCYRKSDSVAGMYETVTGSFYTNGGSGTFIVGGNV